MSSLPHPDLPAGPQRDLNEALHGLHHRAGWPSLRNLARETGVSHTTVSKTFSSPALPSWGTLELLVEAMTGDTQEFHDLWLAASTPADGTRPASPRIAGRRAELAAVRRHLETGMGLLLVTGEAGIGKTRLITTAAAGADVFVAAGRCLPLSTEVPLLPIADIMRSVHEHDNGRWLKGALESSAAYAAASIALLVPELADRHAPSPGSGDSWARQRLFAAVSATLRELALQRPFGLLIEDLHWADSGTRDLLEHLLSRDDRPPVVGTWRVDEATSEQASIDWFQRTRRMATVVTVALPPLSREETADQLRLLNGLEPSDTLLNSIHRRSRGQPLFTEQLAAQDEEDGPLPELLADLLDTRLGHLKGADWAVARALGVADRPLSGPQLAAAAGLESAVLDTVLHDLDARRLLSRPTAAHVMLRHPLLAEAIRRRLVVSEVTTTHAGVAAALASSADVEPSEVATHWRAAGNRREELRWRTEAARSASARFEAKQAAQEWLRVLELWPDTAELGGDPRLTDVHREALTELINADMREVGLNLGRQAIPLLDDPTSMDAAEIYRHVAVCLGGFRLTEALEMVTQAVNVYERHNPSEGLALALENQSHYLRELGRYEEARFAVSRSVEVGEALGDSALRRRAVMNLAWYDLTTGNRDLAVTRAKSVMQLEAGSRRDPVAEIVMGVEHTDILLVACAPVADVEEAARPGLEFAEGEIAGHLISILRSNVAQAMTDAGHVATSASILDPLTTGEVHRDSWAVHLERAHLDVVRGRLDAARRRLVDLTALPRASDDNLLQAIRELTAVIDLWEGRPNSALEQAMVRLATSSTTQLAFLGSCFVVAARAAADLAEDGTMPGEPGSLVERLQALKQVAAIDPFGLLSPSGQATASGCTWNAELARLAGAPTVDAWISAAREWDSISHPHDAAYCRWRGAQVALRDGQGTVAARLLRRAAADSREHVPLNRAIAATAAGVR